MAIKPIFLKGTRGKVPVTLWIQEGKYHAVFPYDQELKDNIKAMRGSRWNPKDKSWVFTQCQRNDFQLSWLLGNNPYAHYDKAIPELRGITRPLFPHQEDGIAFMLARRQCIVAYDMGLGKSLMGMELIERVLEDQAQVWWVGPRLTLFSLQIQFDMWDFDPSAVHLMTYERLVRNLKGDIEVPQIVIFDESSKIKTWGRDRTEASMDLAEMIRKRWGHLGHVILFSGRPAPNTPTDWWSQCEVACPGFLKEGQVKAFENRLCVKIEGTARDGKKFFKVDTWLDDEEKCAECGRIAGEHIIETHAWRPSKNEVSFLDKRLDGLVMKRFKEDCLDLPEKHYRRVECAISEKARRLANLIKDVRSGAELLSRLRQLSDGFQYTEVPDPRGGDYPCSHCEEGRLQDLDGLWVDCASCQGTGSAPKMIREVTKFATPKTQVLMDLLDEYEEYGRIVVFAPFHASVDRVVETCVRSGWNVIRFDGRNILGLGEMEGLEPQEMLERFQTKSQGKIAFVANQESSSMGLTLTASPAIIYYSNSWKPEARTQSEARIHRPGADKNRGCTIIDIIHLPEDAYVLTKIRGKADLQNMSLGKIKEELREFVEKWEQEHADDQETPTKMGMGNQAAQGQI